MLKRRALFLFAIAVTLGIFAAFFANQWIQGRMSPITTAEASTAPVVVAALEIPFGQRIDAAHVKTIAWPSNSLPKDFFSKVEDVEGLVAKQKILPGELLLRGRIAQNASGSTLSAIITANMRAITVRVNDVIGVGGFLLPGNRVDVLSSRKDKKRVYTKTILEDLKVLAVDQTASPDKDKPIVVRAVTLEVTPKQAVVLVKATQEGNVQLALRNPEDKSRAEVKKVSKPKVRKYRKYRTTSSVTVIRGTNVNISKVKM
ncbi:MAG: Flp pilus assembly protein CpaB [Pseudomonadota bacterium]